MSNTCFALDSGQFSYLLCFAVGTHSDWLHEVRGGLKNGLFLGVDNFAMVNEREACGILKIAEFCLEKSLKHHITAFKYSLASLLVQFCVHN